MTSPERSAAASIDAATAAKTARRALPWGLVLLAAAGTFGLTLGTRQSMGLFLGDLNTATGLGLGSISLAFAFGQLAWGLTQPFAGAVADRHGAGRVLTAGLTLIALGTLITPYMTSTLGLILAMGLLSAGGAGMAGPAVLMAATTRLVPADRQGLATGIVNAGGSLGQFVIAPIAGALILGLGWVGAMQTLGLLVLLALPAAWVLRGAPQLSEPSPVTAAVTAPVTAPAATSAASPATVANDQAAANAPTRPTPASLMSTPAGAPRPVAATARLALRQALQDRNYRLLSAGFFVCGFHVAFLATHLPGVVASCGLPLTYAAWSLAVLGLFNIVGSLAMGWSMGRWRMKSLLSLVYAARAVAVLVFLLAPKTGTVVLVFAAVMGLTFLSTVPPTAGLVAKFFGTRHMAMLFGVVMLSHQVGGFLGAWLGGQVFEATGSYNLVWMIDIALAVGAALVHLPIQEAPVPRPAASAA